MSMGISVSAIASKEAVFTRVQGNLYPVPDPPEPLLLYEEEGSLWRKRADLEINRHFPVMKEAPVFVVDGRKWLCEAWPL